MSTRRANQRESTEPRTKRKEDREGLKRGETRRKETQGKRRGIILEGYAEIYKLKGKTKPQKMTKQGETVIN